MGYRRVTLGASKLGQFPEAQRTLMHGKVRNGNFKEMPSFQKVMIALPRYR
jgi:hypothetical protein